MVLTKFLQTHTCYQFIPLQARTKGLEGQKNELYTIYSDQESECLEVAPVVDMGPRAKTDITANSGGRNREWNYYTMAVNL